MDLVDVGREMLGPVRDLGGFIREQRTAAKISLRALADKAGVSNPYLSQVERGLRRPSAAILAQIADGLSISAESLLIKAGILRQGETTPVVSAIHADPDLTERQKSSLLEIYRAFVHDTRTAGDLAGSAEAAADTEVAETGMADTGMADTGMTAGPPGGADAPGRTAQTDHTTLIKE